MAEKKKLSVAEILAAARKADGKGGASEKPAAAKPAPAAESPDAEEAAAPVEAAPPEVAAAESPKPKPGGARPSVAEMMAMARAQKAGPAAAKPAPAAKPAALKATPAEKPGAKTSPKAEPAEKAAPVKDTASILSSARGGDKLGPMSKSEAAAKGKPTTSDAAAKEARAKIVVPPMPPKPEYAKPKAKKEEAPEERRGFMALMFGSFLAMGFTFTSATFGLWTLGFARFMFPNILTEPPSRFKVGFPSDFPPGKVEEKFKAQFGVWVVNAEYQGREEIFALRTVCTHLGCTPNWLEGEQKFKCPCHGSGFYKDGINFEGPAPRPLERYSIRLADDGQLEVDKSKLFQEEMGQWIDPASFVPA